MAKVTIHLTDRKKIRLNIDEAAAPITAANFLKLCRENFYIGLCFHRVISNFMIQGGGYYRAEGRLIQKISEPIKGEFLSNGVENPIKHLPGTISMARTQDKNSASCQFFICVAPCEYLDGQYAGFGSCADKESLDAAIAISEVETGNFMALDDVPVYDVLIERITVEND